jgi:hypothetical protein
MDECAIGRLLSAQGDVLLAERVDKRLELAQRSECFGMKIDRVADSSQ